MTSRRNEDLNEIGEDTNTNRNKSELLILSNVLNYLDSFPNLYKAIQAAEHISKIPIEITPAEFKKISTSKNFEVILGWMADTIQYNLDLHFHGMLILENSTSRNENKKLFIRFVCNDIYDDEFVYIITLYKSEVLRYIRRIDEKMSSIIPFRLSGAIYIETGMINALKPYPSSLSIAANIKKSEEYDEYWRRNEERRADEIENMRKHSEEKSTKLELYKNETKEERRERHKNKIENQRKMRLELSAIKEKYEN